MKTISTWKQGHEFESRQDNQTIRMDGNRKAGFNPKALLLSALAACTGIDVVDILEKMRVEFTEFTIEVETNQTENHPKVFRDIQVNYRLKTGEGNREKVIKAIELSLDKYCGVAAMLRKNSPIHYKLELN